MKLPKTKKNRLDNFEIGDDWLVCRGPSQGCQEDHFVLFGPAQQQEAEIYSRSGTSRMEMTQACR